MGSPAATLPVVGARYSRVVPTPSLPPRGTSTARSLPAVAAETGAVALGVAALGRLIMGPLRGFPAEDAVNVALQSHRTPARDRVTWALSTYSDTVPTIVVATALGGWRWWRGGDLRAAARPLAVIALETAVFMSAAAVVGRPRPEVIRMDRPAPTSSFPSGHTGATTALHLTIADIIAETGSGPAQFAAGAVRLAMPPLVGWSRLYRGMHHPSDVAVGLLLGVWSHRTVRRVLGAESTR